MKLGSRLEVREKSYAQFLRSPGAVFHSDTRSPGTVFHSDMTCVPIVLPRPPLCARARVPNS